MNNPRAVPAPVLQAITSLNPDAPTDPELRGPYEEIQNSYRRLREQNRRLWQHRPQSWRHLLSLSCGAHLTILFGRFVGDMVFWGPRVNELNVLSGTASAIAIATRLTWHAMFSNPYSFLGYRRPGKSYRRAVQLATLLTTVPALILHVAMIPAAYRARRTALSPDPYQVILALVLLIQTIGLYLWMVRRFLLRQNDEHYEPTIAATTLEERSTIRDSEGPGTYCDSSESRMPPREPWRSQSSPLSRAYVQQRVRRGTRNETLPETSTADSLISPSPANQPQTDSIPEYQAEVESGPGHCQTIAWFDYMPDSRLSDPLITYGLMIYGIILTWMIYPLIQENSLSKMPSDKAKGVLYAPLGVFVFCAYANKRFMRTSFFARISMPPPPPWVMVPSVFGKPIFRNPEDGSVAKSDPRLRVPLQHPSYLNRYNETARACECHSYWGHLGRQRITDFRIRPPVFRFAFLGLAFFLYTKGFVSLFQYPTHSKDGLFDRPDLTRDDFERQIRILGLQGKLMVATTLLMVFLVCYTAVWGIRLAARWGDAVLKYAPPRREEPEGQIQL